MAAAIDVTSEENLGSLKAYIGTITMDDSYPTNGEAVDFSDYLSEVKFLQLQGRGGYIFRWDAANSKIKAFYADYDAGADGDLIEVANGVDLSAEVIDFILYGL